VVSTSVTVCPDGTGGTYTVCPSVATRCPVNQVACAVKLGDVNLDNKVNILDLINIRNNLNRDVYQNGVVGDMNGDGKVNILDLILTRNNLNR